MRWRSCEHEHKRAYHVVNVALKEVVAKLRLCDACAFPLLDAQLRQYEKEEPR